MKLIYIKVSTNKDKKLMAKFELENKKTKTIHFGARGYKDYTIYYKKNIEEANMKKKAYIARHKENEDWNDPLTAGTLSRYILWEKPTIEASIKYYVNKFKL
jgi:hypothetical protein